MGKLYRDSAATSVESALMPWNGRHDVLIDRFDARAVLEMIPLSPKVPIAMEPGLLTCIGVPSSHSLRPCSLRLDSKHYPAVWVNTVLFVARAFDLGGFWGMWRPPELPRLGSVFVAWQPTCGHWGYLLLP